MYVKCDRLHPLYLYLHSFPFPWPYILPLMRAGVFFHLGKILHPWGLDGGEVRMGLVGGI